MAVTVWTLADYAAPGVLRGMECSAAAIKVDANSANVKFKVALDDSGTSWPADGAAIQVGTLPKAVPLQIVVKSTTALEITDGLKILFRSLRGGEAGSWVAL